MNGFFLEFVLALVLVGYYGDWLLKNHRVPVAPLHAYAILQMEKENKYKTKLKVYEKQNNNNKSVQNAGK